jgi:serine/threonine protein kinase
VPKLKNPINLQTTFGEYTLSEIIGEGGAGRVYGGEDSLAVPIAVKVLTGAGADKRRRFRNEMGFLQRNRHPNVVEVFDNGFAQHAALTGPFYVMHRYDGSLRDLIKAGIDPAIALRYFIQVMDGVECAHLKGVVHRDLKPENVLYSKSGANLLVADFGVASFVEEALITQVETGPQQRLANFVYAAPEQRTGGQQISEAADIFALGLMLNEMFTGRVPHGASPMLVGNVRPEMAYLDALIDRIDPPRSRPTPAFHW